MGLVPSLNGSFNVFTMLSSKFAGDFKQKANHRAGQKLNQMSLILIFAKMGQLQLLI